VGLAEALLDRPMAQLSTGEQQRVSIARALQNRPEVLLLDEPTSALDPGSASALLALLADLKASAAGLTLVVVTHGLAQAQALADRIALLEAGKVVEVAATAAFFGESAGPRARAFVASGRLSSPSPPRR
jgi:ABC-type methionine transport system ATPase subunit